MEDKNKKLTNKWYDGGFPESPGDDWDEAANPAEDIGKDFEDDDEESSVDKTVVTVSLPISPLIKPKDAKEAALIIIYGKELGRKHKLGDTTILGRSVKCHIQIDEDSVSRNHCRIKFTGRSYVIKDLGSTNGTYVNDEMVDEIVLKDGDLIKIGGCVIKFLSGSNIESSYHEEIYRLMTIDGLTQVYNKRYFLEILEKEMSRSRRYGRELSLIMFDIDHFKHINDTYGHLAGDAILKQLCQLVKAKIRREDFIARYGGEEFTIILPEIENFNAIMTAEKIRKLVEQTEFIFEDITIPVTISLGVSTMVDDLMDVESFIKKADENLYNAKNSGRNRVCG